MPVRTSELPASKSIGTSANDLVQLDGTAKLPAVDGSQLTDIQIGAPSTYSDAVLADSPIGFWLWDGNVNDSSGNGNTGTKVGTTFYTPAIINAGKGISLDGSGDYVTLNALNNDLDASLSYSVETWINGPGQDDSSCFFSINQSGGENIMWFYVSAGNSLAVLVRDNESDASFTGKTINSNQLYHVVYTYDNATKEGKIYVDGILEATKAWTSPESVSSSTYVNVGMERDSGASTGNFYKGIIGPLSVYGAPLTATQVLDHYTSALGSTGLGAFQEVNFTPPVETNSVFTFNGATWDNSVKYGTGADQLLQMASDGKLPAVDGSNLTGITVPNAISSYAGFKGARVVPTTNTSTANVTWTELPFNSEDYDTNGYHDNVTNNGRLTAPEPGYYLTTAVVQWASNSSKERLFRIRKNSTDDIVYIRDSANTSNRKQMSGSTVIYLDTGDFLTIETYQSSGGNLNVESQHTNFTITKIEAANAGVKGFIGATVRQTVAQTCDDNVAEALTFQSADYDTATMWSGGAPTDVVIPEDGYYCIQAQGSFGTDGAFTGRKQTLIVVNGSSVAFDSSQTSSTGGTSNHVSYTGFLSKNDVITLQLVTNGGSSTVDTNVGSAATQSRLTAFKVESLDSWVTTLDGLTDVANTTPADKHVLIYDGVTDNRYENRLLVEADISDLGTYATTGHTHTLTDITDSGTAAAKNFGTGANELVELNGSSQLPAVDGSLLTGITSGVNLKDETSAVTGGPHTTVNFVGDNVTVTDAGSGEATVTITGGGVGSSPGFKGASVYHNTTQTLTTGTDTAVAFNSENYDTNTYHDNATNNTRLTAPEAGYYLCTGVVTFVSNATGQRILGWSVNGGTDYYGRLRIDATASGGSGLTSTHVFNLSAGDYVELIAQQNSGGNLDLGNVAAPTNYSKASITKIETATVGGQFSGASAYQNSAQTLTNGTVTAVTLGAEVFDTDTYHDNSTNNTRMTVPTTGYYHLSGYANFTANATGRRVLLFRINGVTDNYGQMASPAPSSGSHALTTQHVAYLTAGDYVELFAYQNSGGNLDLQASNESEYARLHIHKLETTAPTSYAVIRDAKTAGTSGGTATSGSWQTRDLTEITSDPNSIVTSLSANEFTLPAGSYLIDIVAPAYKCDQHCCRLYDVTGAAEVERGTFSQSANADGVASYSVASIIVQPASSNAYRVEHQVSSTQSTNGWGRSLNGAFTVSEEVYTVVKITKFNA